MPSLTFTIPSNRLIQNIVNPRPQRVWEVTLAVAALFRPNPNLPLFLRRVLLSFSDNTFFTRLAFDDETGPYNPNQEGHDLIREWEIEASAESGHIRFEQGEYSFEPRPA